MGYPVSPAVMVLPLGSKNNSDNNSFVGDFASGDNDDDQGEDTDDNDPVDNDSDDNDGNVNVGSVAPNVALNLGSVYSTVHQSSPVEDLPRDHVSPVHVIPDKIRRLRSRRTSHRPLTFSCSSVKEIIESVHGVRAHPGQELEWDVTVYDMENFDPEVHLYNPLTPTRDRPTVSVSFNAPVTTSFNVPPAQSVAVSHLPVSPGVGVGRGVGRVEQRLPFSMQVSHHQSGFTTIGLTPTGLTTTGLTPSLTTCLTTCLTTQGLTPCLTTCLTTQGLTTCLTTQGLTPYLTTCLTTPGLTTVLPGSLPLPHIVSHSQRD